MNSDAAVAIPDSADAPLCPPVVGVALDHEISITNDAPTQGIFDPSIVYPAGASAGAMAYSAVPGQDAIRTHIAVSADHGATWTMVAEANTPEVASLAESDPHECSNPCNGKLISEVGSLIYDADDPDANRRWKLFAHRYLVGPGAVTPPLHYRLGTIALQTAPQPAGPWTAPQKLIGWTNPDQAYSSTGVVANVSNLGGTVADCVALTEPGALWLPGAIDLAVGCIYVVGGAPRIRIELLRSPDHGATWASVGTVLRPEDSACLTPNAEINAANLFALDGHEYIAATPSDATGYHGCLVFEIDDPVAGQVARDARGRALVHRALTTNQFSGACTFADGAGGYALDVGFLQETRRFRIFAAGVASP